MKERMKKQRIMQPIIQTVNGKIHMDCPQCRVHDVVESNNAKHAYTVINKFRCQHEHHEKDF